MNVTWSTIPSCAPSFHSIAPPFVPAMFPSKYEYLKVVSSHVSSAADWRNTPPPRLAAVLLINLQSSTVPSAPDHITAPPSPPVLFSPRTDIAQAIPFASFCVKLV